MYDTRHHPAAFRNTLRLLIISIATLAIPMPILHNPQPAQAAPDAGGTFPASTPQANDGNAPADARNNERENAKVGWIELSGTLREGPVPMAWVDAADVDPSLREIVEQLDHVAVSEDHLGVVIHLDRPNLHLTQANVLAEAIARVRAADKPVFVFAEEYDLPGYLLASSADKILLQQHGRVHLTGISIEEFYVAGLLERLGVRIDLMQKGEFKGVGEAFTRSGPSEQWSQNINRLLDDVYEQIAAHVSSGRDIDAAEFEQLMAEAWTMTDADYVERGVVDRLTARDLAEVTEPAFGRRFTWDDTLGRADPQRQRNRAQQMQNPFAMLQRLFQPPDTRPVGPSLAVIHAVGPVTSGESRRGDGPLASSTIGSKTMIETLRRVREDPRILAAVIRIDSPGGSAVASEVIWQAIRELSERKPVYVSIGMLAASGGYYLASAADEIYLSPQSIVGSIGVVGGKLVLGEAYEKLDIEVHRRHRGPMADIFNSVEPFTQEQRHALEQRLERVYEQFTDRVKTGRGDRIDDIDQIGHGRVFTGREAVDNGLADHLGGLNRALENLAEHLDLEPDEYEIIHLPPPMSLGEFVASIFGVRGPEIRANDNIDPWLALARKVLGEDGWEAANRALTGLMLLRDEPVLMLMPQAIVVR